MMHRIIYNIEELIRSTSVVKVTAYLKVDADFFLVGSIFRSRDGFERTMPNTFTETSLTGKARQ